MSELTREEAIVKADDIIDEMSDSFLREKLRDGKSRRDFAGVAMNIAEDRYSAGSTASLATIYIMLARGFEAAKDFAADLAHHES